MVTRRVSEDEAELSLFLEIHSSLTDRDTNQRAKPDGPRPLATKSPSAAEEETAFPLTVTVTFTS